MSLAPLPKPMRFMGLKKWSTAVRRGAPGLLVNRIEAMGETCPESENPVALEFETHFLSCTGIAGFGDERQNVAHDPCGVRRVVWEGEVSS